MGVPRPAFPKTLREFQSMFATEEACQKYLAAVPLAGGFRLSAVREPEFLRNRESPALAMHSVVGIKFPLRQGRFCITRKRR